MIRTDVPPLDRHQYIDTSGKYPPSFGRRIDEENCKYLAFKSKNGTDDIMEYFVAARSLQFSFSCLMFVK